MHHVELRLKELGFELPLPAAPAANYVPFIVSGSQLFISGQLPMGRDGLAYKGSVGDRISLDDGKAAALLCALNILAQAKAALGSLDRIGQCLRLNGFVNTAPDFGDHPAIINGASDLMAAALGERGRHTRIAVGVASLPFGASVEIDAIFAIA